MRFGSYAGANRWSRAALTEPENGSGPGRFTFAHGRNAKSASRILEGLPACRGLVGRRKGIGCVGGRGGQKSPSGRCWGLGLKRGAGGCTRTVALHSYRDGTATTYPAAYFRYPGRATRKYLRMSAPSRPRRGPPHARQVISRSFAGAASIRTTS